MKAKDIGLMSLVDLQIHAKNDVSSSAFGRICQKSENPNSLTFKMKNINDFAVIGSPNLP